MSKNMNDYDLFSQKLNEIKKEYNLTDSKEDREKLLKSLQKSILPMTIRMRIIPLKVLVSN